MMIKNKTLSIKEYFDKMKPYLKDIVHNLNKSYTRKIQLIMAINFTSSKDTDQERSVHLKSDNI